jgi:hypothetical protein
LSCLLDPDLGHRIDRIWLRLTEYREDVAPAIDVDDQLPCQNWDPIDLLTQANCRLTSRAPDDIGDA